MNSKISDKDKKDWEDFWTNDEKLPNKDLNNKARKDPYVSKDLGILKYSVPDFIKRDSQLMSMINKIEDAKIEDGGSGAFYIFLKKKIIK